MARTFIVQFAIVFLAIALLVGCAPIATTVGTTPTPAATDTPAPKPSFTATQASSSEIAVGVVEVDLLNMREGPGTNYPILSSLVKGEKFYILGDVVNSTSNRWLLINPSGESFGWVIGDQTYVTVQQERVDQNTYLIWQKNIETAKSILTALTPPPQ